MSFTLRLALRSPVLFRQREFRRHFAVSAVCRARRHAI